MDVLVITSVSGDQRVKQETKQVLRLLEIADPADAPVMRKRRKMVASVGIASRGYGSRSTFAP